MYTYTATHRFLVLSAPQSAPFHPGNNFLVLSPAESGPDPRAYDEQPLTDSSDESVEIGLHRCNSSSSTASSDSRFNNIAATLPKGFLYLGNPKTRRASQ